MQLPTVDIDSFPLHNSHFRWIWKIVLGFMILNCMNQQPWYV